MAIKRDIVSKFSTVYWIVVLLGIIIVGRVAYLQIFEKEKWSQKAKKMTFRDIIIRSERGDILADDGRILASSVPHYEIRMDMMSQAMKKKTFKKNIDTLAYCLSNLFSDTTKKTYKTKEEYVKSLLKARDIGNRYYLIQRNVNYNQLKQLKGFPVFKLGKYKGGFIVIQNTTRKHPFKSLANRTIGRLANKSENQNIIGIEGAYDHYLKGTDGISLVQKLSGNFWMPLPNNGNEVEPQNGKNVVSTININIQDVVENALLKQLRRSKAEHGCAVVMEVETGKVKAIANLRLDTLGNYRESYNYAIGEATAPGSTFKLASLMAAFEDGYIDLLDTVDTQDGIATFYSFEIKDSHKGGYGKISMRQVLALSSNTGVAKTINKYYKDDPRRFIDRLFSMGFKEELSLELKGEGKTYIKYPKNRLWSNISLPQMSIGYEVELTPLYILTFYNAVANNGKMMKPMFVEGIRDRNTMEIKYKPEVLNSSICSEETIKKAKLMLESVVEEGTAKNIKSKAFGIAGKTGTAKIYDKNKGEYINKYKASFVGYFPADKPKYSCIVFVYAPEVGSYYGSSVAAPVFKEIADKIYSKSLDIQKPINRKMIEGNLIVDIPYSKCGYKEDLDNALDYLDIPKQYYSDLKSDWVGTQSRETFVEYQSRNISKNLVPNVLGMGARDAVSLLENIGLKVTLLGRGTVVKQSLSPGTRIYSGEKITIRMSKVDES
ncbi:MAG: peptidoglycan glycosyltransferase [Bacteroidia bacterium]|nr:MAG: peptidoglycan glycosyltransferase [Bacteroidia bacterium]PIE86416.1 MAG: peptidoglycan glycosyltransferase [Bacteroidia bacterium]